MRLRVIHFFLSVPASGLSIASAETIHLNHGRIIVADRVQENHNRYQYEIGEETYAIPKSFVNPDDRGDYRPPSPGAAKVGDLPTFVPADTLANEGDLVRKILKEGKVDTLALAKLEGKANAELRATADSIAGNLSSTTATSAFCQGNSTEAGVRATITPGTASWNPTSPNIWSISMAD